MKKIWIITSRAFLGEEYFDRLEETKVVKTAEEAKKVFDMECSSQTDWFWDGSSPYDHYYEGDDTYVLTNDEAVCVVTLREVEIPD